MLIFCIFVIGLGMKHQSNFTICVRITRRSTFLTMQRLLRVNNLISSFITNAHYFGSFNLRFKHTVCKVLFYFTCIKVLFGSTLRLLSVKLNRSLFFFFESYITARFILLNMCCYYGITEKKPCHADN